MHQVHREAAEVAVKEVEVVVVDMAVKGKEVVVDMGVKVKEMEVMAVAADIVMAAAVAADIVMAAARTAMVVSRVRLLVPLPASLL